MIAPATLRRGALPLALHVRRPAQRHPLHGLRAQGVRDRDRRRAVRGGRARPRATATLKLAREPLARCAFAVEKAHERPAGEEFRCREPALRGLPGHAPAGRPRVRPATRSERGVKDPVQGQTRGQDPRIRCRRPGDPGPRSYGSDSPRQLRLRPGLRPRIRGASLHVQRARLLRARRAGRAQARLRRPPARGDRARGPREPHRQRRGRRPRLRPRRARQRLLAGPRRPRRPLARALAAAARVPLRLAGPARQGGRAGRRLRRRSRTRSATSSPSATASRSSSRPSRAGAASPTGRAATDAGRRAGVARPRAAELLGGRLLGALARGRLALRAPRASSRRQRRASSAWPRPSASPPSWPRRPSRAPRALGLGLRGGRGASGRASRRAARLGLHDLGLDDRLAAPARRPAAPGRRPRRRLAGPRRGSRRRRPRRPAAPGAACRTRPARAPGSARGGRARSSATTVVSPPTGAGAVAITVSEPPPARLRPAASARRAAAAGQVLEAVDQHDGVAAAGGDAAAGLDRLLDGLRLRVDRRRERQRRARRDREVGDLLRAHAGQHGADLEPRTRRQRAGEPPQRLALARARRAGDDDARALAERRQPLDRVDRRVLGAELRCARPARRPAGPRSACPRRPPRPGGR